MIVLGLILGFLALLAVCIVHDTLRPDPPPLRPARVIDLEAAREQRRRRRERDCA